MESLAVYFHGASNDKVADPEHKKILPPSAEHPFFVSPDPNIAVRYAMTPTDSKGRLADVQKDQERVYENSRVYLVRIDNSKLKTFDPFTRRSIQKLSKFYSQEALSELERLFISDDYTIMRISIMLSNTIKGSPFVGRAFNAVFAIVGEDESAYQKALIEGLDSAQKKELLNYYKTVLKEPVPVYLFFFLDMLKYMLEAKLIDSSFFTRDEKTRVTFYKKNKDVSRRDIKKILFKQIQELGFNAVVERNTFRGSKVKNELALLEIEPIVDACPKAVKIEVVEKAMGYAHSTIASGKAEKKDYLKLVLSKI